jgi:hypothetical protein
MAALGLPTPGATNTDEAYGFFTIREVQEPGVISLTLRGQMAAEIGPDHELSSKGGSHTPLGSSVSLLTANSIALGQTEYDFDWSAKFMKKQHCEVSGFDLDFSPEGLVAIFQSLAIRGRLCAVELPGGFARRGIVRGVKAKPTRGYQANPNGSGGAPGCDQEVKVTIEWSALSGQSGEAIDRLSGFDAASLVAEASDKIASAASNGNPFGVNPFEQISDAVGNIRQAGADLRSVLKRAGDLAKAPAGLALAISSAAVSFNNSIEELRAIISDVPEIYLSVGQSFEDLTKLRAANGAVKKAAFAALDSTASIFDALERRQARVVRALPGQSLVDIARKEVGNPDKWQEIATANGISGRFVPEGFVTVEIPPGLGTAS